MKIIYLDIYIFFSIIYYPQYFTFTIFHRPNQTLWLSEGSKLKLSASTDWIVNFRRRNFGGSHHKEHSTLVLASFCPPFHSSCLLSSGLDLSVYRWLPVTLTGTNFFFPRGFYICVIKDSRLHSHFASHRPQNDGLARGPSTSLCA